MATSAPEPAVPFTERSNELTLRLSSVRTGSGVVRLLRASDAQVFAGFGHAHAALSDASTLNAWRCGRRLAPFSDTSTVRSLSLDQARAGASRSWLLRSSTGSFARERVCFLGCGTATIVVAAGLFYYCNSGGDSALLLPSELAEDDTARGVSDLRAVIERAGAEDAPVMVIGVTCGMSAPYVAAQLDFVLGQICGGGDLAPLCDFTPVLIGFNPVALARDIPIEMWSERPDDGTHTFRDVARRMEQAADDAIIINPVIGPESLCGSTRMKGGFRRQKSYSRDCVWCSPRVPFCRGS